MSTHLDARLQTARAVARDAGHLALDFFRNRHQLTVERKGVQDTVSEADRTVEELIRRELLDRFPEDAFLGEEGGHRARGGEAPGTWVVDPIDGTACFLAGIPSWCVSVAYTTGREVEIGVVYDPCAEEMFCACRGRGATLNGRPLRPRDAASVQDGMIGVGFSHRVQPPATTAFMRRLLEEGGMHFCNGSGALMVTYVAAGRLAGYYEEHINAWDVLGALALVREAGAWSNDFLAADGLTRGNPVAVCAPRLAPWMKTATGLS